MKSPQPLNESTIQPFGGFYNRKRVWVTGHTGFKGSWLSAWLVQMGAEVTGYAIEPPSDPAHFDELGLKKRMKDVRADIRNAARVAKEMAKARPEIVFHLAAQPIVRASYDDPVTTYGTNVLGTVHVLEALRHQPGVRAAVIITSDKCYENVEQDAGYREDDRLGGKDPYSASKAGAEIAFYSYARSFFAEGKTAVASARAGNVIGGGDWAKDRIVPDCIRAWHRKQAPLVRNPSSTRPWQHVLEPVSGYLALGAALAGHAGRLSGGIVEGLRGGGKAGLSGGIVEGLKGNSSQQFNSSTTQLPNGQSFNFGPRADINETVESLIGELRNHWPGAKPPKIERTKAKPEAGLLRLDCAKARERLGWEATLDFAETAAFTADWYRRFLEGGEKAWALTTGQIGEYVARARKRNLTWAR
jgi:CDP-glucose 4,6-dehydratase